MSHDAPEMSLRYTGWVKMLQTIQYDKNKTNVYLFKFHFS